MKYYISIYVLLLFTSNCIAELSPPKISSITDLDIKKLKIVESGGQLYFMSENGRFVIEGRMTDTWSKKTLDTIEDIEFAATHVDVGLIGKRIDSLNTIVFGNGKKEVIIFVDPECVHCKKLIKKASDYIESYTFKVVVVPVLGDQSDSLSRKIYCSIPDSDKLSALLDNKINSLIQRKDCDSHGYDMTLIMAQLLEIKAVPYIISSDGSYRSGVGPNLWLWLDSKS